MKTVRIYDPDNAIELIAEPSAPPGGGGADTVLARLVASMQPGSCAEVLPHAAAIDAVLAVGTEGDSLNRFSGYANSIARDGTRGRIMFVGSDHLAADNTPQERALCDYTDATHGWRKVFATKKTTDPTLGLGSHTYQYTACDPATGTIYLFAREPGISAVYRSVDGAPFVIEATPPENMNELDGTPAITWWRGPFAGSAGRGVLLVQCGNFGTLHVYDPHLKRWILFIRDAVPGQIGTYHNVMAYSGLHNCAVFGGGGPRASKTLTRLNEDGSITRMPDAPHNVGCFSGMNFVGCGGKFLALGNASMQDLPNQLWQLDPQGSGAWTQLPPPTVTLVQPQRAKSIASCDLYDLGATLYVDFNPSRSPKTRMWLRKAG